jgi:hypothetical protein
LAGSTGFYSTGFTVSAGFSAGMGDGVIFVLGTTAEGAVVVSSAGFDDDAPIVGFDMNPGFENIFGFDPKPVGLGADGFSCTGSISFGGSSLIGVISLMVC